MREIKFRGKRIDNGEWVVGDYSGCSKEKSIIMVDLLEQEDYWVWSATVGQFTGLKDKNGVKIFDGDIVACGDGKVPTEIRWVQESSAFMAYNFKRNEYHLLNKYFGRFIGEVIGNIHDNQELLRVRE